MVESVGDEQPRTEVEVGIRRLRADLASHVQRAGHGRPLVVTVNGDPVARLGPLSDDGRGRPAGCDPASVLNGLAAHGLLRRPIDVDRRLVRPDPLLTRFPADLDPDRAVTEALGR